MPSIPSFATLNWKITNPDASSKSDHDTPLGGIEVSEICSHDVNLVPSHVTTTSHSDSKDFKNTPDLDHKLPPTWPIMPQLFRRRSCEMMNMMGPCVQKAVTHLEMVQDLIEEWFKNGELLLAEQVADGKDSESRAECQTASQIQSEHDLVEEKESSTSLASTYGDDVLSRQETTLESAMDSDTVLAHIGAEDVIEEVMTLLARLEKDRQDTEFAYISECDTVKTLNSQVTKQARKRLVDLSIGIQAEHEACIMDMNELKWHVNYSDRMKDRILSKTKTAEMFNTRLKEDIAFLQEHIPLVEEKLDLELTAVAKIDKAQLETNKELETTLKRLAKTESKSKEAQMKADKEREHIANEILIVEGKLTDLQRELKQCQANTQLYEEEEEDLTAKIEQLQQEKKLLDVEHELIQQKEEGLSIEVRALETETAEVNFEQDRLVNLNLSKKNKLEHKIQKNTLEINNMEAKLNDSNTMVKQLTRAIKDLTLEVEDMLQKIKQCDTLIKQHNKELDRLSREKESILRQILDTNKMYDSIHAMNAQSHERYHLEIQRQRKVEETLKHTSETLKRQVRDETHTRAVLQARIGADGSELVKSKADTKKKTEKANIVVEEVQQALSNVRKKVENLRNYKSDSDKVVSDITQDVIVVKNKMKQADEDHEKTMSEQRPALVKLQKEDEESDKKIKKMALKIRQMTKHKMDMGDSSAMMQKVLTQTDKTNRKLACDRDEWALQASAAQKIHNDLHKLSDDLKDRMTQAAQKHKELIIARRLYFQNLLSQKNDKLAENKRLASVYRTLQNDYYAAKNTQLNTFDERLKMEQSIKNLRQLLLLQQRMHAALLSYFKYRGMYNSGEVHKLEFQSANNTQLIGGLKKNIDDTMNQMSQFLKHEVKWHAGSVLPELKSAPLVTT